MKHQITNAEHFFGRIVYTFLAKLRDFKTKFGGLVLLVFKSFHAVLLGSVVSCFAIHNSIQCSVILSKLYFFFIIFPSNNRKRIANGCQSINQFDPSAILSGFSAQDLLRRKKLPTNSSTDKFVVVSDQLLKEQDINQLQTGFNENERQ